jgi:hypothetical protein
MTSSKKVKEGKSKLEIPPIPLFKRYSMITINKQTKQFHSD